MASMSSRAAYVRARFSGEVLLDDAKRHAVAEMDEDLQHKVRESWRQHNTVQANDHGAVVGISCSGGGIRSAAFSLGALQRLREEGVLDEAAWMAAVSGGSYIAAAHYLVQRREYPRQGDIASSTPAATGGTDGARAATALEKEQHATEKDEAYADLFKGTSAYAMASPEERWLRSNSSYMSDSVTRALLLAGQVLIGAFYTLLAITLVLSLGAIPAGRLGLAWFEDLAIARPTVEQATAAVHVNLATQLGLGILVVSLLCGLAVVGFRLRFRTRTFLTTAGGWLAGVALIVLACSWILPSVLLMLRVAFAADAGATFDQLWQRIAVIGGVGGLLPVLAAAFGVLVRGARDLQPKSRSQIVRAVGPKLVTVVAAIAAPLLFAAVFLVGYSWATLQTATVAWSAVAAIGLGLGLVLHYVDPTSTSLHTFYKRRLSTAFNVVRRPQGTDGVLHGAAARDGEELTMLSLSQPADMPRLVVAAAANISNRGTTPTGRNAVPFTFSADWIGSDEIGWVRTEDLERQLADAQSGVARRDVTLLAAIAMSGAAVSPAMGKMSRPAYRMLLTLVNARLGVWLPNPRYSRSVEADEINAPQSARPADPRSRPNFSWLFREMAGFMSRDARRIYVTDGGHYENLGLIELLRRGCTVIYCFDASGDPPDTFTTLAETLALARTELGINIPLRPEELRTQIGGITGDGNGSGPKASTNGARPQAERSHAAIDFTYPDAPNNRTAANPGQKGVLVYVKCRVTGGAPWDVRALYERDPDFPDHSTADQLYTGDRLEAYRALGEHLAGEAFADEQVKRHVDAIRGVAVATTPGDASQTAADGNGATPRPDAMANTSDGDPTRAGIGNDGDARS